MGVLFFKVAHRQFFLNAPLRILNAPLRKRKFYNSIRTHQYKRFIRHQHESYKLGGYYAHPLLLIDAHPPLGINETKACTNSSLKGITSDHVYVLGISVICLLISRYRNPYDIHMIRCYSFKGRIGIFL